MDFDALGLSNQVQLLPHESSLRWNAQRCFFVKIQIQNPRPRNMGEPVSDNWGNFWIEVSSLSEILELVQALLKSTCCSLPHP